ncbi:MAG: hypothetical protein GX853_10385, partial [Chloroflexi bacterium]|nr:hypothetical protein [Chloroflexota bacterium]
MRFDLSALILIALFVWVGHRRGLLLTAVGFVKSLISIAIAFLLVRPLSGWLLDLGLFSGSMSKVSDLVNTGMAESPSGLSSILEGLGMPENWSRKILQMPEASGHAIVDSAVNSIWQLVLGALSLV